MGDPVWLLAGAALTLQTVRHALDFSFAASQQRATAAVPQPSSWQPVSRLPGLKWVTRVIAFPIGERFAAISFTAALFTPRTTFVVLLAWGGVAALYGLAGRLVRSL
jgi:hypothetical protein